MGQSRRLFTQKFKQAALKLVTIGRHPTAQVARDLGITLNLLRRWKQEIPGDPIAAFPGKKRRKPHEEELARLTQELARVTQERDFQKMWRPTSPRRGYKVRLYRDRPGNLARGMVV